MRLNFYVTLLLLLPVAFNPHLFAQSGIAEKDKAVIAFDFRYDRIRENELVEETGLQEIAIDAFERELGPIAVDKVMRVFGSVSTPQSFEEFADLDPGDKLPFNFFVQIRFVDEASVAAFMDGVSNTETVEKNGKVYYTNPEGQGSSNLVMHIPSPTMVELGTDKYIYSDSRRMFTKSLDETWANLPYHSIRIAVDLDGARNFVDQAVEAGKDNLPEQAGMFLDLFSSTSTMRLSADLDGDNLLSFVATGTDEEATAKLQGGLEALLGMAKFAGKSIIGELEEEDPDTAKVAEEMLASLKTSKDGNAVAVRIPKPDGFNAAVKSTLARLQTASAALEVEYNYKTYGLGVHNYHDTFKQLPFTPVSGTPMSADLSWRVRILPFIEQQQIYEQMDIEQEHDGETNKQFADQMPTVYGNDGATTEVCWIRPEKMPKSFASIKDGMSNTIMLMQNPSKVPWTQPIDISPAKAVETVKSLMDGQELIVVFYDGHISKLSNEVDEETLNRLFDPDDGKPVDFE